MDRILLLPNPHLVITFNGQKLPSHVEEFENSRTITKQFAVERSEDDERLIKCTTIASSNWTLTFTAQSFQLLNSCAGGSYSRLNINLIPLACRTSW